MAGFSPLPFRLNLLVCLKEQLQLRLSLLIQPNFKSLRRFIPLGLKAVLALVDFPVRDLKRDVLIRCCSENEVPSVNSTSHPYWKFLSGTCTFCSNALIKRWRGCKFASISGY